MPPAPPSDPHPTPAAWPLADQVPAAHAGDRSGALLDELLALALRLGRDAGALIVDGRRRGGFAVDTKSTATDMVTAFDTASEALIVEGILADRPDDGILGEEGADRPGTSGVRWVVDPIDGTTNYLYDFPAYSVSIAAELDGVTVVGVVVDASRGRVFHAVRGRGAFLDGAPIRVSGAEDLDRALVGTGFGYAAARRAQQAAVLTTVLPQVRDIRRAGSAALDLAFVACGRLDAYYEFGLNPWDLAAGALIASEGGAFVGALDGGAPRAGETIVVCSPALAPALLALLAEAGAATVT